MENIVRSRSFFSWSKAASEEKKCHKQVVLLFYSQSRNSAVCTRSEFLTRSLLEMPRINDSHYTRIHPEVYTVNTPEDVLACTASAAVVERRAPFGGGLPIETPVDEEDEVGSTISNPDRWNNNFAKKMLDMQFNFSCGPLRVSKVCPMHWNRLHATHKTLMPLPGGRLELFKAKVPHASDEELLEMVRASGVGRPRPTRGQREASVTGLPQRRVDTPLLQHLLKSQYVQPLPVRPDPNDPTVLLKQRLERASGTETAKTEAPYDGDSIFSRTVVASSAAAKTSSPCLPPVARSSVSGASNASKISRASNASRVSKLKEIIAQERSLTAQAMEHIRAASAQLDSLEQVLQERCSLVA